MSFLVIYTVKTIEWSLRPIFTSDFFFFLGELTCRRDIPYLCWININTLKVSTSVTNKELQNNLEFMPLVNSLGNFYETNKKLFIQFEAKIQQNYVSISVEKNSWEPPVFPSLETLMTSSTHFPKEKTRLQLGNILQHNKFIKFLKQHKFGVSGTALDDYTNFSCAFTDLLWYKDPHYNKLKSRNRCTFPDVTVKNLMNFNKQSEHGHKAKTNPFYRCSY